MSATKNRTKGYIGHIQINDMPVKHLSATDSFNLSMAYLLKAA